MKYRKKQENFFNQDEKEKFRRYRLLIVVTLVSGVLLIFSSFLILPQLVKPLIIPLFVLLLFITGAIRLLGFFDSPWLGHSH